MSKKVEMTKEDARRIQSAADKNSNSKTAKTDFNRRGQSAADKKK